MRIATLKNLIYLNVYVRGLIYWDKICDKIILRASEKKMKDYLNSMHKMSLISFKYCDDLLKHYSDKAWTETEKNAFRSGAEKSATMAAQEKRYYYYDSEKIDELRGNKFTTEAARLAYYEGFHTEFVRRAILDKNNLIDFPIVTQLRLIKMSFAIEAFYKASDRLENYNNATQARFVKAVVSRDYL